MAKKSANVVQIWVTLDPEVDTHLKDFIKWQVKSNGRSLASFIRYLLRKELSEYIVSSSAESTEFKRIK